MFVLLFKFGQFIGYDYLQSILTTNSFRAVRYLLSLLKTFKGGTNEESRA